MAAHLLRSADGGFAARPAQTGVTALARMAHAGGQHEVLVKMTAHALQSSALASAIGP